MAAPTAAAPALALLTVLQPQTSGSARAWQSTAHPDPRIPLLATASADKSVGVWNLRDFSLVSTINGGHKRSIRTVAWKDYGPAPPTATNNTRPVVLATGSFDANVGIWIWNDSAHKERAWRTTSDAATAMTDDGRERDHGEGGGEDEDEEWHFATLLTGPDSEIKAVEFSPPQYPAKLLATSSRDKSVWIWEEVEPDEWETIAVMSEHTGDVKCVSWCAGARRGRQSKWQKLGSTGQDADVDMADGDAAPQNGSSSPSTSHPADDELLGLRAVLASGSYDDTIRLWRDVEEEGDWICVAVIEGHRGTVWDVKWERHVNYAALDLDAAATEPDVAVAAFEADWTPRLISCSDDQTVRTWRRELSPAERAKRAASRPVPAGAPTGFASARIPSVIRPASSLERWVADATLPPVHVRSVYAVDWSPRTGWVVSCGGDGTIAVYREDVVVDGQAEDVAMNGAGESPAAADMAEADNDIVEPYRVRQTRWTVVATVEAAHDEYEVNHVCWARRHDKDRRWSDEEVVVSTGDDGAVRIWTLQDQVYDERRDVT